LRSYNIKLFSIFAICCLGILVYSNSFLCSFHFDDGSNITQNPAIRNIYNLPDIWNFYHSRFLAYLSLAFNYHFNGLDVFGYHLFNLAVHLISAILVWWLTLLTLSTPAMKSNKITWHANIISFFAGLVFVSHPIQTEAVTYIWERCASMTALFYLASLCFYIYSRLQPSKLYYFLSLIMAFAAMFTKENAVTLPLMVLSYEFTFLKTGRGLDWRYVLPFMPILFIVPVTLLFSKTQTFQALHGDLRVLGGGMTPMHYLLTQFRAMFTYIRLVFLPVNQNFDYDYPIFKSFFELPVFTSFLLLMIIFYGTKQLFLKYRLVSFSIFWFFLTLIVPESSFWAMGDVMLEHRLYLPLAGYCIFLVSSVYYLVGKDSIKTMAVILSLVIACNSVLTYQRNKVWKDDDTFWNDAVKKSPHKARPYNNLGSVYYNQGNFTQAITELNKAIAIDPDYAEAYYNRGLNYYKQGNLTQALSDCNKAIEINPKYAQSYNNRGLVYSQQGNFVQAISDYNKAIEINPKYAQSYNNRGLIYDQHDNFTQAISDYNKAIETKPDYAAAYYNRAIVYYQSKKYDQAWENVRKAERLGIIVNPAFIDALEKVSGKKILDKR